MAVNFDDEVNRSVQKYYTKTIKSIGDFKTCPRPAKKVPPSICKAISEIHPDVAAKNYGCGLCIPSCLEDLNILDLGCGAGHDCFVASSLVGPNGHVTGIDMTNELVEFATKYKNYHSDKFGHRKSNVEFILGKMENLAASGIKENSNDIVISNCVICLCSDKPAVFREAFRVLKPGGELYFSDMYADRPLPDNIRNSKDEELWGEGLSGSLYWKDMLDIAAEVGFSSRLVTASPISLKDDVRAKVGDIQYASATYRLFKVIDDKTTCGTSVVYKGTITDNRESLVMDTDYSFKKDDVVAVDSQMAAILRTSRYAEHFNFDVDANSAQKATANHDPDPFQYITDSV